MSRLGIRIELRVLSVVLAVVVGQISTLASVEAMHAVTGASHAAANRPTTRYGIAPCTTTTMPQRASAAGPPARAAATSEAPSDEPASDSVGHVAVGAYTPEMPYDDFSAVDSLQEVIGHKLHHVLWFQAWGDQDSAFYTEYVTLATQKGFIPVITWEPWKRDFTDPSAFQADYSLAGIAAGRHDEYIRSWATAARDTGASIVIRFAQEQSTEPGSREWYPWQGDPENYKLAFRHIVSVFREEGADNVQFMWSAMWLHKWGSLYYPGGDVVDYVGTTELNHGTAPDTTWAQWRSFDEMFGPEYQAALPWNKPMFLTELGSAEQGGDKAAWLRDCFTSFRTSYPLVAGVLLLEVTSDREWPAINWSVTSSPAVLEAFRAAIRDPYFD